MERWRGGVCMCSERYRCGEVECVCVVRERDMWRGGVCMCSEIERERDVERWSVYV